MSNYLYPLASLSQIETSPSREDGIPRDLEEDLRAYGCKLIQQAGILLRQYVPFPDNYLNFIFNEKHRKQVSVATAQILFQRFWFVTSLRQFGVGVSSPF